MHYTPEVSTIYLRVYPKRRFIEQRGACLHIPWLKSSTFLNR